jgi:hypothetical protein
VKALLDFYAKCLDGGAEAALNRIGLALGLGLPQEGKAPNQRPGSVGHI